MHLSLSLGNQWPEQRNHHIPTLENCSLLFTLRPQQAALSLAPSHVKCAHRKSHKQLRTTVPYLRKRKLRKNQRWCLGNLHTSWILFLIFEFTLCSDGQTLDRKGEPEVYRSVLKTKIKFLATILKSKCQTMEAIDVRTATAGKLLLKLHDGGK